MSFTERSRHSRTSVYWKDAVCVERLQFTKHGWRRIDADTGQLHSAFSWLNSLSQMKLYICATVLTRWMLGQHDYYIMTFKFSYKEGRYMFLIYTEKHTCVEGIIVIEW